MKCVLGGSGGGAGVGVGVEGGGGGQAVDKEGRRQAFVFAGPLFQRGAGGRGDKPDTWAPPGCLCPFLAIEGLVEIVYHLMQ